MRWLIGIAGIVAGITATLTIQRDWGHIVADLLAHGDA